MENKAYLENLCEENRHLVHATNILERYRKESKHKNVIDEIAEKYCNYVRQNVLQKGYSDRIVAKRVRALNGYYNFLHEKGYDNFFNAQTKFRSTILEEFMYVLFRDYIIHIKKKYGDKSDKLDSGSIKAYSNLYFTSTGIHEFIANPQIKVNEKDQDFAIYRGVEIGIDSNKVMRVLNVPIIAIENKTYVDKTMLDSVMAVADKIKQGNPYVHFSIVTETYDVTFEVDPYYSNLDQIYVLRKCKRKADYRDIDANTVLQLFHDVQNHIERTWSDVQNKMETTGLIM